MNAIVERNELQARTTSFLAEPHRLFIDGEWIDAVSEQSIDVINPATGKSLATLQAAGAKDVDKAVRAARRAFDHGPWTKMPPGERAKLLLALADAIEETASEIAFLETLDNGMPVASAKRGVALSVTNLRYFAGWCGKIEGHVHNVALLDVHAYSLREPVGVVGLITPWNVPFALAVQKLSQALAAGCTAILKPAELTSLTALKLGKLIQDTGFPPGVVNIVTGYGDPAGKALVEHEGVDKISFTGSTATGKWIVQASAGNLKRVSLELGGKSPTIVFPDADLGVAIQGAAMNIFNNAGQVCVAGSRLFVHKAIFDQVVEGVADVAKKLKIGSGLEPETQIGPLISQGQLSKVSGYIQSGLDEGAEVIEGGGRLGDEGYFIQPTVMAKTNRKMRLVREEIFGPVVCAMPIDDDDLDAIARQANDTVYGLAAYLWTRDVGIVHKLAAKIKAGYISVNGGAALDPALPFGGYKQSGWGRENGMQGLEAFLETKAIAIRL